MTTIISAEIASQLNIAACNARRQAEIWVTELEAATTIETAGEVLKEKFVTDGVCGTFVSARQLLRCLLVLMRPRMTRTVFPMTRPTSAMAPYDRNIWAAFARFPVLTRDLRQRYKAPRCPKAFRKKRFQRHRRPP